MTVWALTAVATPPNERSEILRRAFELVTGMKMSRNYNPLAFAKQLGFKGRTKIQALVWVIETFNVEPSETIRKALAKHNMAMVQVPVN